MSKKLSLVNTSASSLKEVWECFIISKTSKCVSDSRKPNGRKLSLYVIDWKIIRW